MTLTANNRCPVSIGETRGSLTVKGFDRNKFGQTMAICSCACGRTHAVSVSKLASGHSKTCGCARSNRLKRYSDSVDAVTAQVFATYRQRAKKLGVAFTLSKPDFKLLILAKCVYCGSEPSRSVSIFTKTIIHSAAVNGVDRLSNEAGYTLENSVSCCPICNYAKRDMTYTEFKDWALRLSTNLQRHVAAEGQGSLPGVSTQSDCEAARSGG